MNIDLFLNQVKSDIKECLNKKQYENALVLIRMCADITYCYNQYYCDDVLEDYLKEISEAILQDTKIEQTEKNTILFYDGFGYNDRGLIQIYLKALCKIGKVIYITRDKSRNSIPDVLSILNENNGIIFFIKDEPFVKQIKYVNNIVETYKPSHMFMYTYPHDVVIPIVFNKYEGIIKRYQINLTDHAFWLGKKSFDYCIEFRDWGASLSYFYRNLNKSKIVMLPYYPNINWKQEFLGYPFPFDEKKQRFIFSGGQLYKTLGGENKYYKIIDYILAKYTDVIFWYAGSGDRTEMDKLIKKYPDRLYLTTERKDFFQIIQRCEFYLSTYPYCGGLMFQYAAAAGKVPLTLRYDSATDGFLINQEKLGIEFDTIADILRETSKLLSNKYYLKKQNNNMNRAIISENKFLYNLRTLMMYGNTEYLCNFDDIDLSRLKKSTKELMDTNRLYKMVSAYKKWIVASRYKKIFLQGRILRLRDKLFRVFYK